MEQYNGNKLIMKGKLSFVDLAGSEKWKSHQLSTFSQERLDNYQIIII
jgi:hypothetical protein